MRLSARHRCHRQSTSQPASLPLQKKQTLLVPADASKRQGLLTGTRLDANRETVIITHALLLHYGSSGNPHACIPLTLCNNCKSSMGANNTCGLVHGVSFGRFSMSSLAVEQLGPPQSTRIPVRRPRSDIAPSIAGQAKKSISHNIFAYLTGM